MKNKPRGNSTSKLSHDEVMIAKELFDSRQASISEIAARFGVHPATISYRLQNLRKESTEEDKDKPAQELKSILDLLITFKKCLATNLLKIDFSKYDDFKSITDAMKILTSIFSPLHTAYRAETQKTAATVISFTNIVERNWENEEKRKQKIVDVLSKKV